MTLEVDMHGEDLMLVAHRSSMISGLKEMRVAKGEVHDGGYDKKMSPFEMHYIGTLGEHVVASLIGAEVRTDITDKGDGGIDMELNGQTIQVKTRKRDYKDSYLYVNTLDHFKADWLIGCTLISPTRIRVDGFISRERFTKECEEVEFKHGDRLGVRNETLTPIERFREAVEWKAKQQ